MITDIFIRTYHKDIRWLNYALQSIAKYCHGFRQVIVCIPEAQSYLLDHLTAEKVVICPNYGNDYLGQQASKMSAFKYTDADLIFFTDSDCIFFKETTPENLIIDNKPFILKTPYSKVGDAICWKRPTEMALRKPVIFEYMRRNGLLYYSSTLKALDRYLGGSEQYILKQKSFSEFNLIGAYAEAFEPFNYTFLNTDEHPLPELTLKQYWSHGIKEAEIADIESLIATGKSDFKNLSNG